MVSNSDFYGNINRNPLLNSKFKYEITYKTISLYLNP